MLSFPLSLSNKNITPQKLYQIAGSPHVPGCVDGTHVRINGPKDNKNDYVNRKGYHLLNAQIVCDADCSLQIL